MALIDVIRAGVKIANNVTKTLQTEVSYRRCTGSDAYGSRTFSSAVVLRAVLEEKQQQVRDVAGMLVQSSATLTFLDAAAVAAATGGAGFDIKDEITLPDGRLAPIINTGGYIDPRTELPAATELFLG